MITNDINLKTAKLEDLYPDLIRMAKTIGGRFGVNDEAISDAAQEVLMKLHRFQEDGFPAGLQSIERPGAVLWSLLRFELLRGLRSSDRYCLSTDADNTEEWLESLHSDAEDMADLLDAQRAREESLERQRAAQERMAPFVEGILGTVQSDGPRTGQPTLPRGPIADGPILPGSFAEKIRRVPYSKEALAQLLNISARTLKHYQAAEKV